MFTGIVECIGRIARASGSSDAARLVIEAPFAGDLAAGESVAVDGCCLTVLPRGAEGPPGFTATSFEADLSPETLARTTLGSLPAGRHVNLERAARVDARNSGHVVQGHVDAPIEMIESWPEGAGRRQRWSLPASHARFVAEKGSLAIDGVSLTVAALGRAPTAHGSDWFEVALVPHTLVITTLGERVPGDRANLEVDVAAKQLVHAAGLGAGPSWLDGRPWLERYSTGAPWEPLVGYCRAVRTGTTIRVSGTAPVADGGGTHAPGDAERQAERCCDILRAAVAKLGGPDAVIVRTRMFVTDVSRWEEIARAHARAFGSAPPVTTMVEVSKLISPDMLVEIEADAEIPPRGRPPAA